MNKSDKIRAVSAMLLEYEKEIDSNRKKIPDLIEKLIINSKSLNAGIFSDKDKANIVSDIRWLVTDNTVLADEYNHLKYYMSTLIHDA